MLTHLHCALIVLTLGGWLAPGHAVAQTSPLPSPKGIFSGLGFFHIGYATLNTSPALGPALAADLPEFPGGGMMLGGAGYGIIHGIVIGGSGGRCRLPERTGATYTARLEAKGGQFELGYAWHPGRTLVIPLLGIGSQTYIARLTYIRNPPASFADVVTNPGRETQLTKDTATGSAAILSCHRFGGLVVGLRVQYLTALNNPSWRYDDHPLTGSPAWRSQRLSISLLLGGGFF